LYLVNPDIYNKTTPINISIQYVTNLNKNMKLAVIAVEIPINAIKGIIPPSIIPRLPGRNGIIDKINIEHQTNIA
jgi:hypothetical protein